MENTKEKEEDIETQELIEEPEQEEFNWSLEDVWAGSKTKSDRPEILGKQDSEVIGKEDDDFIGREESQFIDEQETFQPRIRRINIEETNPFLEQQPIETQNLERNLENTQQVINQEDNQQEVYNAPQYSYDEQNYSQASTRSQDQEGYPEQVHASMNIGQRDFITRLNRPPQNFTPPKLLNPREMSSWKTQEAPGYPEDEKKYYSTLDKTKSRRRE